MTRGLPVSEFVRHAPLSRAGAASVFRELLPATLVVNCFLPSRLSASRVELAPEGTLRVIGGEAAGLADYAANVRKRLAVAFRRCGGIMLPGSFSRGTIGSDVHYASTLPMRRDPAPGQCSIDGEIAGLEGVYAVDGAALPALPAKSHTLSIMANAHRIGSRLARRLRD